MSNQSSTLSKQRCFDIVAGVDVVLQTRMSGRNVCWPRRTLPLVCQGEYADGTDSRTDGQIPGRYITLSTRRGQRYILNNERGETVGFLW